MTNFSVWNFANTSTAEETQLTIPVWISFILNIIVNSVTCPFTVLLNLLVVMAAKSRPRLQSKANILLACLAVTDAATGLIIQPAFILCATHLALETFERLVAIMFTMHYHDIVTNKNIMMAVTTFWVIAFSSEVWKLATDISITFKDSSKFCFDFVYRFLNSSCFLIWCCIAKHFAPKRW